MLTDGQSTITFILFSRNFPAFSLLIISAVWIASSVFRFVFVFSAKSMSFGWTVTMWCASEFSFIIFANLILVECVRSFESLTF